MVRISAAVAQRFPQRRIFTTARLVTRRARGLATASKDIFAPLDTFQRRHVGPDENEITKMLRRLDYNSLEDFIHDTVPQQIRIPNKSLNNDAIAAYSESELLKRARDLAKVNKPVRSYIGMGYWNAVVPPVILRNVRLLICDKT